MADVDAAIGQLIDRRYRLLERIGAGSMGVVYRAESVPLRRTVALKLLDRRLAADRQLLLRFQTEILAVRRLKHAACVPVVDSGVDGWPYVAMELVSGRTLRQVLQQEGALPARRTVNILRQVLGGLEQAHRQRIVHHDLRPENLMLLAAGAEDEVRILDFGLGALRGSLAAPTGGPPRPRSYNLDVRVDLDSVGAVLHGLLTGRPPVDGAEVPELAALSVELQQVVQRALGRPGVARFTSAAELQVALERTPEGLDRSSGPARVTAPIAQVKTLSSPGLLRAAEIPAWPDETPPPQLAVPAPPAPSPPSPARTTPSSPTGRTSRPPPERPAAAAKVEPPKKTPQRTQPATRAAVEEPAPKRPARARSGKMAVVAVPVEPAPAPTAVEPALAPTPAEPQTKPAEPAPEPAAPGPAPPEPEARAVIEPGPVSEPLSPATPPPAIVWTPAEAVGALLGPTSPPASLEAEPLSWQFPGVAAEATAGPAAEGPVGTFVETPTAAIPEVIRRPARPAGAAGPGQRRLWPVAVGLLLLIAAFGAWRLLASRPGTSGPSAPDASPSAAATAPVPTEAVDAGADTAAGEATTDGGPPSRPAAPAAPAVSRVAEEIPKEELATLAEAEQMIAAKEPGRAIKLLAKYQPRHKSARSPYILGNLYCDRLWWPDCVANYRLAIGRRPAYRSDPVLIQNMIDALIGIRFHGTASRFLSKEIGAPARPLLEKASRQARSKYVQERARRALEAMDGK